MSIFVCREHGVSAPRACCAMASRAQLDPSPGASVILITEVSQGVMRARAPRRGTVAPVREKTWVGGVLFACPECGGPVDTADAMQSAAMPSGMRYLGVPCRGTCGNTYTVEISDAPDPAA